ncbi:MAG: DNA polymerase IV [Proteobacteria bacterium]|jgi:DNA polymerase IV|nr:DNA polymerase IV [Pseudomonadota bacterium]
MTQHRKIIHIDMDAFFASVEQRDNPELRGHAVIVGGQPDSRGVVAACSYEARQFGIHSAMPCSRAYRLCPNAIFLKPRFEAYRSVSIELHKIFSEFTALIEPLSLDEAYLDVTECSQHNGSATLIAREIKQAIKDRLNLVASAGVSYNKFLAKIASDMDKPDGLYVIRPEQAATFIRSLPIRKFFGVGKVTEGKMHRHNIFTGADLGRYDEVKLCQLFGKSGNYYYQIARGIDNRPVRTDRKRKSIGKENTFSEDLTDINTINDHFDRLAEQVANIMLKRGITARTITIKIKYHDFSQITRSITPPQLVINGASLQAALPGLIKKTELGNRPCRLLGVSVSNFVDPPKKRFGQALLFEE